MKVKVTEQGVLIPKELLGDSQEVEIIKEQQIIIVTPSENSLDFEQLLEQTQGIWTEGSSLEYQQKIREEWG